MQHASFSFTLGHRVVYTIAYTTYYITPVDLCYNANVHQFKIASILHIVCSSRYYINYKRL